MRTFEDRRGRAWDVVVGRESWGALVAILVPKGPQRAVREAEDPSAAGELPVVRQASLQAAGYEEALAELAALDLDALRALLAGSVPKHS